MSTHTVRAFLFKWSGAPETLNPGLSVQDLFEQFLYHAVKHEVNKEIAEKFGVVVTQVKSFPTDKGWMILDKHTKRVLHRELKNEYEVQELFRKHNYVTK